MNSSTTDNFGAMISVIEKLCLLYEIFPPPMTRAEWLGITEQQDKLLLDDGVYPKLVNPHPSAMKLLPYYT